MFLTILYLMFQSEPSGLYPNAVNYLTYDNIKQNSMVYQKTSNRTVWCTKKPKNTKAAHTDGLWSMNIDYILIGE